MFVFVFSLTVHLQPSTVVYKPAILSQVKSFFTIHDSSRYQLNIDNTSSRIRQVINTQIEEIKNSTKTELANVVSGLMKKNHQVKLNCLKPKIH